MSGEQIQALIRETLAKEEPVHWMLTIMQPNSKLKCVDPVTYKNHRGTKQIIAIIHQETKL